MGMANESSAKTPAGSTGWTAQEMEWTKQRLDASATTDPLKNCSRPRSGTTNCAARMFSVWATRTLEKELPPQRTTGVPAGRRIETTAGS